MAHTVNHIQKRYFIVLSNGSTISELRFYGLRANVYATDSNRRETLGGFIFALDETKRFRIK